MTDTEIRITIAECCGWVVKEAPTECFFWYADGGKLFPKGAHSVYELPNYPEDLNAMHKAEEILTGSQCLKYETELNKVTKHMKHITCFGMIHATARQRAEAFLRTLNKWKDLKPKHNEKDHNPNLSTL